MQIKKLNLKSWVKMVNYTLIKLLTKSLIKPNVTRYVVPTNVTATTPVTIGAFNHKTNTGTFIIIGSVPLCTSRFTSSVDVFVNGVAYAGSVTNVQNTQPPENAPIFGYVGDGVVNAGATVNVSVVIKGQDSSTTATIPPYHSGVIMCVDIITGD